MDEVRHQPVIKNLINAKAKRPLHRGNEIALRQRKHLLISMRSIFIPIIIILAAFAPRVARAQSQQEQTQISIGAPAQAKVGERLTVQAVLVDSRGNPIPKAAIYFTTQADFLHNSGDVVLAQAVTNNKGQAVARFTDDFSDSITLAAEFRGDSQYASSNATIQIAIDGQGQIYAEHVGVDIPGFNVPPRFPAVASVQSQEFNIWLYIENLWPGMNAWPIAAALIIVWSMYLLAVKFIFGIATSKSEDQESTYSTHQRRSL
jgi:hypothetical protein